jgi:hypothetical protein
MSLHTDVATTLTGVDVPSQHHVISQREMEVRRHTLAYACFRRDVLPHLGTGRVELRTRREPIDSDR